MTSNEKEGLQIGQLAKIYSMQLETKRMSEFMEVGKEYTITELIKLMGCSRASVHGYGEELKKHGIIEKWVIQPNGYKLTLLKRVNDIEYKTMDFDHASWKVTQRRERETVMPELPSHLLKMFGYTDIKPADANPDRVFDIKHVKAPPRKFSYSMTGSSLQMMEMA
jgi:hypothetical protein